MTSERTSSNGRRGSTEHPPRPSSGPRRPGRGSRLGRAGARTFAVLGLLTGSLFLVSAGASPAAAVDCGTALTTATFTSFGVQVGTSEFRTRACENNRDLTSIDIRTKRCHKQVAAAHEIWSVDFDTGPRALPSKSVWAEYSCKMSLGIPTPWGTVGFSRTYWADHEYNMAGAGATVTKRSGF